MKTKITKTFTITCSEEFMEKFELFLSMLYLYGAWGHSTLVGMFIDGDGDERPKIDVDFSKFRKEIILISGVSSGIDIAGSDGICYHRSIDEKSSYWKSFLGILYKDGVEFKRYFGNE